MDINTTLVIVIAIFGLIAVSAIWRFRKDIRIKIKGPQKTGLQVNGSSDPVLTTPGVKLEGAKSSEGRVVATDGTGRGAAVKQVEAKRDVIVKSAPPKINHDPKE